MQVSDDLVNQMLRNLPADQQQQMAAILKNDAVYEVVCNTQDEIREVEVIEKDKDGNNVVYQSGKNKGQHKTIKEKQVVRRGTKGAVIALIMTDGSVMPTRDTDGFMWLRSSRRRTDGEYGFECWCGQDSRIAPNEQGILKADGQQPSREDIFRMAENLRKQPPKYATIYGERDVDGFVIKKVGK